MEGIIFTRATPADAARLGRVHSACWRAAYAGIATDAFLEAFTPEARAAFFARILPVTPNEHYLIEVDGADAGMIAIGAAGDDDIAGQDCGELIALYLLPAYWSRGIGAAAMDFSLARLRALGYGDTVLTVLCDNTRARRFYARYGFEPDSGPEPIELGVTLLEMQYRLKRSEMTGA